MEISKERIVTDLTGLGVRSGDHVGVGISFKSIGNVSGGPTTFIEALLEVVGGAGTIMVPTYSQFFRLSELKSGEGQSFVFDHRSTPGYTGVVAETIRKHENATRSRHPTNSVAALGRLAHFLTEGHDERARAYMPYSRLAEADGKVLCVGIGDRLVGIRHEAQHLAGLLGVVPLKRGVKYQGEDGRIDLFIRNDVGGCVRKLPKLVPELRKMGYVTDGSVGNAEATLSDAKAVLRAMTDRLRDDPTLNLCGDIYCIWCREVERRLELRKRIRNARWFQRNALVVEAIGLINRFRL